MAENDKLAKELTSLNEWLGKRIERANKALAQYDEEWAAKLKAARAAYKAQTRAGDDNDRK